MQNMTIRFVWQLNSQVENNTKKLLKMNKLIFLTGLLTALFFIGTAQGTPFETVEDENDKQVVSTQFFRKLGALACTLQKRLCKQLNMQESSLDDDTVKIQVMKKLSCAIGNKICGMARKLEVSI